MKKTDDSQIYADRVGEKLSDLIGELHNEGWDNTTAILGLRKLARQLLTGNFNPTDE